MTPSRYFLWLIPLLLIGLTIWGGIKLRQNTITQMSKMLAEAGAYRRSPGCVPNAQNVDQSLPPCQDLTVAVVRKTRQHEHSSKLGRDYNENALDVRDESGRMHHLTDISDDLWNSVQVGDQVGAKTWRGHISNLDFGGAHSTIMDVAERPLPFTDSASKIWATIFFIGLMGSLAWSGFRNIRSRQSLLGG